ncbi:YbaY family lipoprotein, partial [Listeria monocytogenes]|nr:YbaY family lipoprotein [Listeria monocytogenes]
MKKLPLLLAASILAGCGTQQSTSNASFDGEVFYRERIALPPSARLSVSLEDVSLADAPSVQLASQTREITSQVPLAFQQFSPALPQALALPFEALRGLGAVLFQAGFLF